MMVYLEALSATILEKDVIELYPYLFLKSHMGCYGLERARRVSQEDML